MKAENPLEAAVQDVLGLLMQAEAQHHQGHFPMVLALLKDAQRKLVASFRPQSPKKTQPNRADAELWARGWLGKEALYSFYGLGAKVAVKRMSAKREFPYLYLVVLEKIGPYEPGCVFICSYANRHSLKAIEGAGGKVEEDNGTAD